MVLIESNGLENIGTSSAVLSDAKKAASKLVMCRPASE
jgi:hypothetical protein